MVKVLFIAGGGRTGSTILHNVLGQVNGFAAVGELRYVWGRGVLNNQSCGCGVNFADCPFWSEVMQRAFGGIDAAFAREMLAFTESHRIHDLPLAAFAVTRRRQLRRLGLYRERLGALYAAIQSVSGCRVIVDSSKNPSYGYLLREIDHVDPYFLHFVRDAPPVAHSWGKRKDFEPGVPMARKSPRASALQWLARNATAELFLPSDPVRRVRLRYEDVMQNPRDQVESVVRWVGERDVGLPFVSQHVARLDHPNHSVFGNAVRFQRGQVMLRRDDTWREQMATRDRRLVETMTFPLRLRYGYLRRSARTPQRQGLGGRGSQT
jgi:hypothetical protein